MHLQSKLKGKDFQLDTLEDLVKTRAPRKCYSVVTYTCGHQCHFTSSPPKEKDYVTCRTCMEDVYVTKVITKKNRNKESK